MRKKKSVENTGSTGEKTLKLDYPQTFKVGFAFAIIMLFWTAYDFVVPLLLEHAYGLSNAMRGLIMGLDNLLSLFMLPLFGKISDKAMGKLVRKWGRRTPFIVIGTIASVLLMVFVPVATMKQQEKGMAKKAEIEAQLNNDDFMNDKLTKWYDAAVNGEAGAGNYCDLDYLSKNDISREKFIAIRYDEKLKATSGFLGLGGTTYTYEGVEGEIATETVDGKTVLLGTAPNGKTYQEIKESNDNYKKYVAAGINTYISDEIHDNYTNTKQGKTSLAVYMVILLLVLIAMATFRSPAVALMPDVTPKPLRSQANAIINLCGGIGGAVAFLIYTIALMFPLTVNTYTIIFASVAAGMLLLLGGFLGLVNEKKLVAKCQETCKEYGIDDFDSDENPDATAFAEELIAEGEGNEAEAEAIEAGRKKRAHKSPKEWWGGKTADERAKLKSFWLILASIFMWFMGYNAISSNLSVYTTKALNLSAGTASIISGVSMAISAIAFIPVGALAAKIGRRKSIMIGFALAVVSFFLIFFFVRPSDKAIVPAALFAVFYLIAGFGLIIANVNTFPMVTELSTAETVGQYTGYYYTATMSAQAITPFIAGLIMDNSKDQMLFLYSAICIIVAIVLMLLVKHGDSKPIPKKNKLEQYGDLVDND
ncbi:MAG: MFS transporter [Eubacteriales bacterium]|nr:MFS transporter [Christensenellaceae bacterium]MDY3241282.1 MFS transporter [Eubacteriales bacterium]